MLAAKVVQEQGIEVIGMTFVTPFFTAEKARAAARREAIRLEEVDITEEHLIMLRAPRYGYGRNMNPCIDCHALMLKTAGNKMKELGADFLITGEVLGQRPMSQTRQSLHVVAKQSGFEDVIVRPLSARLLPETVPEKEGKIDRSRLLAIQGRGRKTQLEMAGKYGITDFSNPAGGCLLTDPNFSKRLSDLFKHQSDFQVRDLELLKTGRHIRISDEVRSLWQRTKRNTRPSSAYVKHIILMPRIIRTHRPGFRQKQPGALKAAASICARYSDAPRDQRIDIECALKSRRKRSARNPAIGRSRPDDGYKKRGIVQLRVIGPRFRLSAYYKIDAMPKSMSIRYLSFGFGALKFLMPIYFIYVAPIRA